MPATSNECSPPAVTYVIKRTLNSFHSSVWVFGVLDPFIRMPPTVWGEFAFPIKSYDDFCHLWLEQKTRRARNLEPDRRLTHGIELEIRETATFSYLTLPPYDLSSTYRQPSKYAHGTRIILKQSITESLSEDWETFKAPVWKASINSREVIVKIFQACFSQLEWTDELGCHDFFPEEEQAHREAFAYSALQQSRGRRIPRSFGFYTVSNTYAVYYE